MVENNIDNINNSILITIIFFIDYSGHTILGPYN